MIVKTVIHYQDGSTLVCLPQDQPPEVPPSTDRWAFDHLVTTSDPNLDIVIPGPVPALEIDLLFTAGPEPATSKRVQILGVAGTRLGQPWVNEDMLIYLVLSGQKTWTLRHGIGVAHADKAKDQVTLTIQPGETVSVSAGVDLAGAQIWAEINGGRRLEINTPPQRPYPGNVLFRLGEPRVHGGEGPWWGARDQGEIWRPV